MKGTIRLFLIAGVVLVLALGIWSGVRAAAGPAGSSGSPFFSNAFFSGILGVNTGASSVAETETPDVTETPEATEAPEVTEAPDATETPQVGEDNQGQDVQDASPEVTEAPEATEAPQVEDSHHSGGGSGGDQNGGSGSGGGDGGDGGGSGD